MGTLNMLGLAKRTKARFLISSTSGTSQSPTNVPIQLTLPTQRSTAIPKSTPNPRNSKCLLEIYTSNENHDVFSKLGARQSYWTASLL
jgi:nucleoside-diphosphate-sugar epimerase